MLILLNIQYFIMHRGCFSKNVEFTLWFSHPKDSQLPFLHCVKPTCSSLTWKVFLSSEIPTGTLNTLPKHPNFIKLCTRSPRQLSNCAAKKKKTADSQPLKSGLKKRFGAKLSLDSLPFTADSVKNIKNAELECNFLNQPRTILIDLQNCFEVGMEQ